MRVLVLNPGSSSLKSSVVETAPSGGGAGDALASLGVDWGVDATAGHVPADDIRSLIARYEAAGIPVATIGAVGYRVVHGGEQFGEPVLVTPEVVRAVNELRSLAPLHNGIAAITMDAGLAALPQLPQVAAFDTAFHATLPEDAFRYPVPEEWYREFGVRRYGFHGLSVAWATERAAQLLGRPATELGLVVAHLGSGCSATAVDRGRSVDTSMGLTPLEGLMMGTRAGSIDPGIVFYLLRNDWRTREDLADELDHRSGLLGVSGRTSDVRDLLRLEASGDRSAALALTMFCRHAAEWVATMATSLSHLDALVFTGGIGENAGAIRARIVARLGALGFAPVSDERVTEDSILTPAGASPAVLRIQAREDLVVAREAERVVRGRHPEAVAAS